MSCDRLPSRAPHSNVTAATGGTTAPDRTRSEGSLVASANFRTKIGIQPAVEGADSPSESHAGCEQCPVFQPEYRDGGRLSDRSPSRARSPQEGTGVPAGRGEDGF